MLLLDGSPDWSFEDKEEKDEETFAHIQPSDYSQSYLKM
jgi:hypothetical protein